MEKLTKEEIVEKIYERWGNVNFELVSFGTAREPITIKCLNCGDTFTLKHRNNLFNKIRKNFCPNCNGTKKHWYNSTKEKLDFKTAQQRLEQTFGDEYFIIEDSYKGWASNCLIRHNICNKIFSTQPRYLFYHSHCPCKKINSKGEQRIKDFLILNSIIFEEQKRIEDIKKAPYDFYLPTYNLLIEFQGRQHFEPVKQFGGESQLLVQQEIDKRKKDIARKNGYSLFYITYKEMSNIEELLIQRLSLTGVESSDSKCYPPLKED